jgi:hypothetical protein
MQTLTSMDSLQKSVVSIVALCQPTRIDPRT